MTTAELAPTGTAAPGPLDPALVARLAALVTAAPGRTGTPPRARRARAHGAARGGRLAT